MLLRLDRFRDPVTLLDRNAILLLQAIDSSEKRETLADGDNADIFERLVIEQNEYIASDAVGLEVSGILVESNGGEPVGDLLLRPLVDVRCRRRSWTVRGHPDTMRQTRG